MKTEKVLADLKQGKAKRAIKLVKEAKVKTTRQRTDLFRVGVVASRVNDLTLAHDAYKKMLELFPEDKEAALNLSVVYISWSRYKEAIDLLTPLYLKYADYPNLQSNLALCHLRMEHFQEAVDLLQDLIRRFPDEVRFYELLATTLQDAGHEGDAIQVYQMALEKNDRHIPTYLNLAKLLHKNHHNDQALKLVNFVLKLDVKNRDGLLLAGLIFKELNNLDAARMHFELALKLHPKSPVAASALASLLIDEGKIDEANKVYATVELGENKNTHGILIRSRLKDAMLTENEIDVLKELLENSEVPATKESEICFAIANYYDRKKNYKEDITYLRRANAARNKLSPYVYGTFRESSKGIRKNFVADVIHKEDYNYDCELAPIFIVGMPRSGSTLTEQIISAHPQVAGYGEMNCMIAAVAEARGEKMLYREDTDHRERLKQMYVDISIRYQELMVEEVGELPKYFTDKQLFNYQFIGLIKGAFPNCRIIHCMRHPVDNCIGIFRQLFKEGNIEFSYDLKNIAEVYSAYRKTMAHWHALFPGEILDVVYEDMVNDTEGKAREVIEYAGLEWDDACLKFYESDRKVKTASLIQVRQPVFKTAVAKWKNHEPYVQDLIGYLKNGGVEI